ncbi:MAG: hypothetical protein ACR2IE_04430 [Candidatus Sumerlaeaceae bacterium]
MNRTLTALLASFTAVMFSACSVEKTQEGEMPKVKVEGGQVPKYDVKTADVDVKATTTTVTVPDIDVSTKEKTIKVPDVDVTMPKDKPTNP